MLCLRDHDVDSPGQQVVINCCQALFRIHHHEQLCICSDTTVLFIDFLLSSTHPANPNYQGSCFVQSASGAISNVTIFLAHPRRTPEL